MLTKKQLIKISSTGGMAGDSGRTRTPNLLIRSQLLYPVELRNRCHASAGAAARRLWPFFA
jgi:hypothetical protein